MSETESVTHGAGDRNPYGHIAEQLRQLAVPVDSLVHDPANARVHGEKNMAAVKASLAAYGQRTPIIVQRQGMVVRAGNARLAAAKELGWKHIAAVVIDEDNATAMQFAIADNRTAELAEWDEATLAKLLSTMDSDTHRLLAFTEKDMREIASSLDSEAEQDDVPDAPLDPITKPGDLILLCEHRLLCGDSTENSDVDRLLGGLTPFMMATDPPYGVDYEPEWRHETGLNNSERIGKVQNDDRVDWTDAYKLFRGDVAYVWHAGRFAGDVAAHLHAANLKIRGQIIWRKSRFAISRGHYHWQHEPCWYAVRDGRTSKWCGDRSQSTVWDIDHKGQDAETVHGTQKPVECMARPIRNHGDKGDIVYDPFLGSGTTLIACEQMGRRCVGMEIDPAYCDVVVQRWENLTGKKATRLQ